MQPHVVEAGDVWKLILSNRYAEFRLVDLGERGIVPVEDVQRRAELVAPAPMPKLDGNGVVAKTSEEGVEILA